MTHGMAGNSCFCSSTRSLQLIGLNEVTLGGGLVSSLWFSRFLGFIRPLAVVPYIKHIRINGAPSPALGDGALSWSLLSHHTPLIQHCPSGCIKYYTHHVRKFPYSTLLVMSEWVHTNGHSQHLAYEIKGIHSLERMSISGYPKQR